MPTAWREWRLRIEPATMMPLLQSTYMATGWWTTTMIADITPTVGDSLGSAHGLHAVLEPYDLRKSWLTAPCACNPKTHIAPPLWVWAIGMVDAHGHIVEHEDDVIRAEHMRILALRLVRPVWLFACPCEEFTIIQQSHNPVMTNSPLPVPADAYWVASQCGAVEGCGGRPAVGDNVAVRGRATLAELRRRLLERYDVMELPLGMGPWHEPIGGRPHPIRDVLFDV